MMTKPTDTIETQSPVHRAWQRISQRLRHYSDQAGQKLGQVTAFEQLQQQAHAQYENPHDRHKQPDQDPMQSLRAQLPQLSRQLLTGRLASVSRLTSQLIPQELMERVSDRLLDQTLQFAELLSSHDALYDEFNLLSLHEVRQLDLEHADELANLVASRNRLLSAAQGAATGAAGFVGIIADLPLSAIIMLRTIYQTAACYGYDLTDVDGRQRVYQILAATDWQVLVEKQTVLLSLVSVQQLLRQSGVAGIQKMLGSAGDIAVFEKLVHELAGSINLSLPDNLTGRAVPVAGSVVGAFYSTRLINSVAALAQASFRQQRQLEQSNLRQLAAAPSSQSAPAVEISAAAVFGHSAADEQIKPQPKKRMVRVKKTSDGEITPNPIEVTPNSDTQH